MILTDNGNGTSTFKAGELKDSDKVTIAGKEYTIGTNGKGTVLDPADLNTKTDGYDVDTATPANENEIKLSDVTDYIQNALKEGKQVTTEAKGKADQAKTGTTADASTALTAGIQIVAELGKGEVSEFAAGGAGNVTAELVAKAGLGLSTTAPTWNAGDSVTVSGKTTTVTEYTPQAAKATYDAVNALNAGDTVTIGSGKDAITYTLVDDEADVDEASYKLTKDMVLSRIQDGAVVDVNGAGTPNTVIGDIGFSGLLRM